MLIGELSRRGGVSARSLRYYEQQGLLRSERLMNGYRDYDEDAVVVVRQIRALMDAGFGSKDIAVLLPCARGERPEIDICPDTLSTIRGAIDRVTAEAEELRSHERSMARLLG
ncbi:MAG: MerR family transcriptional regulator [Propionibacteriales bacterium]|nr:MerR family transcriptional regulator [Propionibacteriales bacterium]